MPCPICGAKCVCRKRGADGRCCSCHKHKTRKPEQALAHAKNDAKFAGKPLTAGQALIDTRVDVWWCARCECEWTVPSLPHNPKCPTCGEGGWFRRFAA